MESIELKRTGLRPLVFEGESLAEADGFRRGNNEPTRWHEIAVYRTEGGRYLVSITFRSRWAGEDSQYFVGDAGDGGDIEAILRQYNPSPPGIGFPPGSAYADRQARVEADLRRRYESLVTELFAALGRDFAETIA